MDREKLSFVFLYIPSYCEAAEHDIGIITEVKYIKTRVFVLVRKNPSVKYRTLQLDFFRTLSILYFSSFV